MAEIGETGEQGRHATVAVTDLYREHHLELLALALFMTGDLPTAEDVVQDSFERLHRGWHRLREPSNGLAYIRSSVLNGCRSVYRRAAVAGKHAPQLAGTRAAADIPNARITAPLGYLAFGLVGGPARPMRSRWPIRLYVRDRRHRCCSRGREGGGR